MLEVQLHRTIGSVTRRVPRGQAVVDLVLVSAQLSPGTRLALGGRACLEVVDPFVRVPAPLGDWGWRAGMRMHWARPTLLAPPLVAVELSPWATGTVELLLVPVMPQSLHWGEGRWNRYFDLAHAAADALVDRIVGAAATSAENWNVF